jgi:hypothetical protein
MMIQVERNPTRNAVCVSGKDWSELSFPGRAYLSGRREAARAGLSARAVFFYIGQTKTQIKHIFCRVLLEGPFLLGIFWRRGWESNPRIKVLQTSPLPLGYRASEVASIAKVVRGFSREPFHCPHNVTGCEADDPTRIVIPPALTKEGSEAAFWPTRDLLFTFARRALTGCAARRKSAPARRPCARQSCEPARRRI